MSNHRTKLLLVLTAIAAALFNLFPLLMVTPAGDAVMNNMQIDCFSKQLWSGIFYPRWCVDANGGMGSPGPIFYFPLPFYISALFHPLGLSVHQQYLASIFLANVVAFIGCVLWLSARVRYSIACFCALIFLWCGYRSELITRTSYAEFWCVALMPYLFYYVRKACDQSWRYWPQLSITIAICMFCHAPATLIVLMGAGLFILFYSRTQIKNLMELALSCVLAAMLGLFHYLPMKLLEGTLNTNMGGPAHWQKSWVNSFIDQPQVYKDHDWAVIGLGISLLAAITIFAHYWHRRASITDRLVVREARAWLIIAIVATFMMFSPSWPIWWIIKTISGTITPWRVPSLIMLAMVFITAVMCEHVWRHRKTKIGDAIGALLFFVIAGLFYYGGVSPETLGIHKQALTEQYTIKYFNTRDVDASYGTDPRNFYRAFLDRPNRKQAEWVTGSGAIKVEQWDAHGITVSGHANHDSILRLEHFYYPIWYSENTKGDIKPPRAEINTGRMLFDVSRGDFRFTLTQHYERMLPANFWWVWIAFGLSLVIIIAGRVASNARCLQHSFGL